MLWRVTGTYPVSGRIYRYANKLDPSHVRRRPSSALRPFRPRLGIVQHARKKASFLPGYTVLDLLGRHAANGLGFGEASEVLGLGGSGRRGELVWLHIELGVGFSINGNQAVVILFLRAVSLCIFTVQLGSVGCRSKGTAYTFSDLRYCKEAQVKQ